MHTAFALESAGLVFAAQNLRRHGLQWLVDHQRAVVRVAEAAGLDLSAEIAADAAAASPTPPAAPVVVDVVIPFWSGDAQYVAQCVQSILDQHHALPTIHLIADGCQWPELPEVRPAIRLHRYATSGSWGPYRIANAVVAGGHCATPWLAIQDADDLSLPDRLWRQAAILQATGADMISSAMQQQDELDCTAEAIARMQREPILRPGTEYLSAPFGRVVNSTRTLRLSWFQRLNGFADLRCGADFDFDNRSHLFGGHTIHDQQTMATRRLHGGSLTTAPTYCIGSAARQQTNQIVLDNLAACRRDPTACPTFGGLQSAPQLQQL